MSPSRWVQYKLKRLERKVTRLRRLKHVVDTHHEAIEEQTAELKKKVVTLGQLLREEEEAMERARGKL